MNNQDEQLKLAIKETGNTICDSIKKVVEVYPTEILSKAEIRSIIERVREHLNTWKA